MALLIVYDILIHFSLTEKRKVAFLLISGSPHLTKV